MSLSALVGLERVRLDFGPGAAAAKVALLKVLGRARLGSAASVLRLHELLCLMRAYPGDAEVLARVESMLERFDRRADLRDHRAALADSGIAGTEIRYRFFAGQAQWLANRWPDRLRLDRSDRDAELRIAHALPSLVTTVEAHALAEARLPGFAALDRLRPRQQTDAVFLLQRLAAMPGNGFTREAFSDAVDATYVLAPGNDTPSRTTARFAAAPAVFQPGALSRQRPDLRAELARPPRAVRALSVRDAQVLIDLARGAMVTRARSLEAFSYANARDAWLVDDGQGLTMALVGVVAERRHVLASYYGGLMLRNGVPIGYLQSDHLGGRAALSFNTFETFRGGEAAHTFARWLAALRHVFGAVSFSIEPYQLGDDNDEALESGAWWFYAKLGFQPRRQSTLRLARDEAAKVARNPRHRTRPAVLRQLAQAHLFFDLDRAHPQPWVPLAEVGLQCGTSLSERAGADRDLALEQASTELARLCGLRSWRGWSADELQAWRRFAPLALLLEPRRWQAEALRALVPLMRAKGGAGERDYVARYVAHATLDRALVRWATTLRR